jgi:hypothetical protein
MAVAGAGANIVGISAGRIVVNTAIPAADLLLEFGAGAKVYLERDTSSAFSSPTVVTSTVLVGGTEQYEFTDTSGTSTSWYRVRVGNSGATAYTDYSAGVQALQVLAYATVDDVRAVSNYANDETKNPLIADLLIDAKELIDERCGRTFARNPQISGDGTFTFRVRRPGQRSLVAALGSGVDIASITTLEMADVDGGTYTTIASGSTGYYGIAGTGPTPWPYEDIELSRLAASYSAYTLGDATLRVTGVLGFTSVPRLVRRASIDMVREWIRQGPQGGVPAGVNQYGTPLFVQGEPHTFRKVTDPAGPYVKRSYGEI